MSDKSRKNILEYQNLKEKFLNNSSKQNPEQKSILMTDESTGIKYTGILESSKKDYVDNDKFIKMFTGTFFENWCKLSRNGFLVLGWIMNNLKPCYDHIEVSTKKIMEDTGISKRDYVAKGMKELCETGFITKYKKGVYLINVEWFFNGDRRVLFDD